MHHETQSWVQAFLNRAPARDFQQRDHESQLWCETSGKETMKAELSRETSAKFTMKAELACETSGKWNLKV